MRLRAPDKPAEPNPCDDPAPARANRRDETCLSGKALIEVENVSYTVPSDDGRSARLILNGVSFTVCQGSITSIMGTSGSGKTTLLRLIAGLLKPNKGRILLDGRDIACMRDRELNTIRAEMGFVFQYSALFDSLTVAENVGFGLMRQGRPAAEIKATVTRLLADVGMPGIEGRLPGDLSGGMRKRVAMARALATQPKVVLFDEPDSGLDPVMTRVIDDLILELRDKRDTTNVVVSHNLSSIWRISNHIIMLNDSRVVADGTPDEVKNSKDPAVRQFLEGRSDGPIQIR